MKRSLCIFLMAAMFATTAMAMNAPKPAPGVLTKRKMQDTAIQLVELMNRDGTMQRQMESSTEAQIAAMGEIPCPDVVRPQLKDILNEALNYNTFKGDIANIYANSFTLEELEWMMDFYKTPLGGKMLQVQPTIYQTVSELSNSRINAAQPRIALLFTSYQTEAQCKAQLGRRR